MMRPLLDQPNEPVNDLTYFDCLDTVMEKSQVGLDSRSLPKLGRGHPLVLCTGVFMEGQEIRQQGPLRERLILALQTIGHRGRFRQRCHYSLVSQHQNVQQLELPLTSMWAAGRFCCVQKQPPLLRQFMMRKNPGVTSSILSRKRWRCGARYGALYSRASGTP